MELPRLEAENTPPTDAPPRPRIHEDLMHLCGQLLHRGAQSHFERRAAMYLKDRLLDSTSQVELDDFHAPENHLYIFSSYFGEFLVVALLAIWWPVVALVYGSVVFVCFLAEFMGYRLLARFLAEYETQNVSGRFLALSPRRLVVLHAYYDSGMANPLFDRDFQGGLRPGLLGLIACMVISMATCAVQTTEIWTGLEHPGIVWLRWAATGALLGGALLLYFGSTQGEDIRGANNNASGVAALLDVAGRIAHRPLTNTDLMIVFTGSHESWMSGTRHLVQGNRFSKLDTYLVSLESIGDGELHYITGEGMLHKTPADPLLVALATEVGNAHGVTPSEFRALPTASHIPLNRGYKAMTVMALDDEGLPARWGSIEDKVTAVDEKQILRAADFTEAMLRKLDTHKG